MRREAARRLLVRRLLVRRLLALALVGGLAFALLVGPTTPLLFAAPWLLLLAPLIAGRYVGERSLLRLARAGRRPPNRRPAAARARRRPAARAFPRGGGLIGCSLAVRPPPARA
jgi:hypothetical protein